MTTVQPATHFHYLSENRAKSASQQKVDVTWIGLTKVYPSFNIFNHLNIRLLCNQCLRASNCYVLIIHWWKTLILAGSNAAFTKNLRSFFTHGSSYTFTMFGSEIYFSLFVDYFVCCDSMKCCIIMLLWLFMI